MSDHAEFHARRRQAGRRLAATEWDSMDSVSHAILDLVEAQNDIAQAQREQQEAREDGTFATRDDEAAAVEARAQAVQRLCSALSVTMAAKARGVLSQRGLTVENGELAVKSPEGVVIPFRG